MAETFIRIASSSLGFPAGDVIPAREIRVTSDIWRRHSAQCKQRMLGRKALRCHCPIWGDGYIDSVRVLRKSLDTRSLDDAQTRLDGLIDDYVRQMYPEPTAPEVKSAPPAVQAPPIKLVEESSVPIPAETAPNDPRLITNSARAFLANCVTDGIKPPTISKYRNVLNKLAAFAESPEVRKTMIGDFEIPDLDRYRASRASLAPVTALKELQTLRSYWEFCTVRGWCKANIAKQIKTPHIVDQNNVVPYTRREIKAIIDACDKFGQYTYERSRAKGMVLTLRNTALRISDIALLRHDRISRDGRRWRIFLRTTKNNAPVFLSIPDEMVEALKSLPTPRGAGEGCPYCFWNGKSKPKSMISVAEETLAAVFRKSGVQDAGAHRFRHTLATELLGEGASFEEVADILGNSPEIVRKHYAKWSKKRQNRVDHLMDKVHGRSRKHLS